MATSQQWHVTGQQVRVESNDPDGLHETTPLGDNSAIYGRVAGRTDEAAVLMQAVLLGRTDIGRH